MIALVGVALSAAACVSSASARHRVAASPPAASSTSPAPRAAPARPTVLRIRRAAWQLPGPLSREVVFPAGAALEIVGGLRSDGTTTAAVTSLDLRTGSSHPIGDLAVATHDAAGAELRGHRYLFGGGVGASEATVQRLTGTGSQVSAASLPRRRSDLVVAVVGGAAYLLGGYDGTTWTAPVLRTTDGRRFAAVARLPVPVRYPAVAVVGEQIWLFGGQAASGPTSVVQRVDVAGGRAEVVGRMPHPLTDASAVVVDGRVLLCGGAAGGRPTSRVQRFDPVTLRFTTVGNLPQPVQDAGSAVVDGVAYLLGGETPRTTASVQTLQFVPRAAASSRS